MDVSIPKLISLMTFLVLLFLLPFFNFIVILCPAQSAQRGHVFHTLSYLYRKYVVYFGCQAHAPRASALRSAKRTRIHDNILRTHCMNMIVYGCAHFYD